MSITQLVKQLHIIEVIKALNKGHDIMSPEFQRAANLVKLLAKLRFTSVIAPQYPRRK